jgi:pyruvate dehydrogenase E2 component (dihydrolipoamide acetyltransferase)
MAQFRLPDLGEGLEEAQLVQWLVRVSDVVQLNQPICQVETAKALVDVPSPYAGTVQALHAQPGDVVPVGAPLITIDEAVATPSGAGPKGAVTDEASGPVLVGYGAGGPAQTYTRRRRTAAPLVGERPPQLSPRTGAGTAPVMPVPPSCVGEEAGGEVLRASPLVRKIAAERGIDLTTITGTGPGGRIRVEDLESTRAVAAPAALAADEERISTVGLRKAIAVRMVRSATTIPHFTEYGLFDASELVALRARLRDDPYFAGLHLTYVPLLVGALVAAVREYPMMNSRWDEVGNAIILKHSIHVGIATDTERGLLVPVIHDAHTLTLPQLAAEAERLVALARDAKLDARSLTGSTITLTNVGAVGPVETGAPLINPPEVCVVGFGAIKPRPTVVGDEVQVRPGAWISMSCDHRVVDGATAAKFMSAIARALEAPEQLLHLGSDT